MMKVEVQFTDTNKESDRTTMTIKLEGQTKHVKALLEAIEKYHEEKNWRQT